MYGGIETNILHNLYNVSTYGQYGLNVQKMSEHFKFTNLFISE